MESACGGQYACHSGANLDHQSACPHGCRGGGEEMKHLLICLIIVGFSGCRTGGGSGGYSGPPKYEMAVRDAINTAIAELQPVTDRELVFKWDRWRYGVKLVQKTGQSRRGSPFIEIGGTTFCGYYSQSVIYLRTAWHGRQSFTRRGI